MPQEQHKKQPNHLSKYQFKKGEAIAERKRAKDRYGFHHNHA